MHLLDLAYIGDFGLIWLASLLGGYLLGSIPFGLVLAKLAGYGDIRKIGSGNIGATNVLRTGNKALALVVLICDSGKGAAAVLLAGTAGHAMALAAQMDTITDEQAFMLFQTQTAMAGLGAVAGHMFPVWLKFKGGKGVATTLGTLLALDWIVGLAACGTWLATALVFRISSLSALVAMAAAPFYAYFMVGQEAGLQRAELMAIIAVLVWIRHHENIRRLLKGEEPKIGGKKKKEAEESKTDDHQAPA